MPFIAQHLGTLFLGATLAAAALALPAQAAGADCPAIYRAGLDAVRDGVFAGVPKPAAAAATIGDASLPGGFLFVPPQVRRTSAEQAALREANALAKRRGAPGGLSGGNERWIAERVKADLSDYLGQNASPFLCENVGFFLGTMRRQLGTIGGADPAAHAANLATQRDAAGAALARAIDAMRPVPLPRFAPEPRLAAPAPAVAGLRESAGTEREAGLDPVVTHGIHRPAAEAQPMAAAAGTVPARLYGPVAPARAPVRLAAGPAIDPDLPPLAMTDKAPPALDTEADRLRAVDRLVEAAAAGGALREQPTAPFAATLPSRPVLARLAGVKAMLAGGAVADAQARLQLVAALSAIEALDYLALAPDVPVDPVLKGLEDTMRAIEAAHAEALKRSGA